MSFLFENCTVCYDAEMEILNTERNRQPGPFLGFLIKKPFFSEALVGWELVDNATLENFTVVGWRLSGRPLVQVVVNIRQIRDGDVCVVVLG